jgi:hypothetical protein
MGEPDKRPVPLEELLAQAWHRLTCWRSFLPKKGYPRTFYDQDFRGTGTVTTNLPPLAVRKKRIFLRISSIPAILEGFRQF